MKKSKKQLKQIFKDFDINDEGLLDTEYLFKALISLDLPIEQSDIPDLFESVGREKEGTVTQDDFIDIVTELMDCDIDDGEISQQEANDSYLITDTAFNMLADPAVNGITLESLLKACEMQYESWTKQQVMEMMNEADLNHDGLIDSDEFKKICKKAGLL
ncbi:uncharacterized protein BX663DRAFT_526674 [Cokeromyces recurvatus]|uniref:uncharacterized protein n=1 Tax=Cokeromyces recurvatus TaxID=90255 RepID=UPI00221F2569|nr:uncharacterized protein BX663DRAFT_526674 [Cokeromyces recurvatus]KAI7897982.1 hypothetical protein BX663DRAFT_526674 [Cokeromyces recurvatus]